MKKALSFSTHVNAYPGETLGLNMYNVDRIILLVDTALINPSMLPPLHLPA